MERRRLMLPSSSEGPAFDANGHAYVDLGLPSGTLWATEPVAGYNTNYTGYAWGDPDDSHSISLGQLILSTHTYGSSGSATKYNDSDGLTEVLPEDDRVRIKWGGTWRTPSKAQFEELKSYCTYNSSMDSYTSNINGNSVSFGPFPYWTRTRASLYINVFGGYYFNSNSLSTTNREYCYGFWGVLEPNLQTNSNDFTFGLSTSSTTVSSYQAGTTTVTLLKNGSALTDATQSEITVSGGDCSLSSFNSNTGVLTISYPANTGSSNTTRTVTITYKGKSTTFTITLPYLEIFLVKFIYPEDVSETEIINPTSLNFSSAIYNSPLSALIKFALNGLSLSYSNGVSYTKSGSSYISIQEDPDNNVNKSLVVQPTDKRSYIYCNNSSWQNFKTITIPSPGNNGINKTTVSFTALAAGASLKLKITSSSETNYDFGAIGTLDNASILSATASTIKNGTTTVAAKVSGVGSTLTVTFSNLTKGDHFVYICYAKDGSSASGNDNCIIEEIESSGLMVLCTPSVTNYGTVIFTKNSSSVPVLINLVGNNIKGLNWDTSLMGYYVVLVGKYQDKWDSYFGFKNIYNPIVYVDSNTPPKVYLVSPSLPSSYNSNFDMYVWDFNSASIKTITCLYVSRSCQDISKCFSTKYNNSNTNNLLPLKTETSNNLTLISLKINSSLTLPNGYVYVS